MVASNKLLKISLHTDFLYDLLPFPSSLAGPRRCPAILLRASLSPSLQPKEREDPMKSAADFGGEHDALVLCDRLRRSGSRGLFSPERLGWLS